MVLGVCVCVSAPTGAQLSWPLASRGPWPAVVEPVRCGWPSGILHQTPVVFTRLEGSGHAPFSDLNLQHDNNRVCVCVCVCVCARLSLLFLLHFYARK